MRYVSLFSGIEAATLAWEPLGWVPVAFSEIDKFPCELLKTRFPNVPNLDDITKIDWSCIDEPVDLIAGGSPCQSFSVAGLRKGLMDPRGNLMLEYLRAVDALRPTWVIWENVPGVLSSNGGRDFATLRGGLENIGYGVAYRVLDAQFFRVAQRRRRVFVVGCAGGQWQRAAAVLFESDSVSGNTKTSKEKRKELTRRTRGGAACSIAGNIIGRKDQHGGNQLGVSEDDVSFTLTATDRHAVVVPEDMATYAFNHNVSGSFGFAVNDSISPTLRSGLHGNVPAVIAFSAGQSAESGSLGLDEEITPTLRSGASGTNMVPTICLGDDNAKASIDSDMTGTLKVGGEPPIVAFAQNSRDEVRVVGDGSLTGALTTQPGIKQQTCVQVDHRVRRLTPLECERLQGFPDGYTQLGSTSDSARYKALGNSMAVPVIAWLGRRIQAVESCK